MIRCQLTNLHPMKYEGKVWNVISLIPNDNQLLFETENNDYITFMPNDTRSGFILLNQRISYHYTWYVQSDYAWKKDGYYDLDEFQGEQVIGSQYSPKRVAKYDGMRLTFKDPSAKVGQQITVSDVVKSRSPIGETRIFQFVNKWVYDILYVDKTRNDSFDYTKRIQDDLARVIKLPYNIRLFSWNGILESDETGVITNEHLKTCWDELIKQLSR